jgi:hypothetical protein
VRRTLIVTFLVALPWVGFRAEVEAGAKKAPPGFTSLFDGKDLEGWKNAGKEWTVEEGTIHFLGKGGRNLATDKKYKDFELYLDWKITPKGDSGIYLRGQPQVQIWDNPEGSGTLWNNPAKTPGKLPLVVADNKPGEWNTFYIKMVGDKVTVKLNDKLVVDNATFIPQGKKAAESGPIELQVHGTPLWFRNIFVKEL